MVNETVPARHSIDVAFDKENFLSNMIIFIGDCVNLGKTAFSVLIVKSSLILPKLMGRVTPNA